MRPASKVTRPKSIATVVVVLSGTCDRSSTPALAAVMTASVVSGVISETDPTKVVLPTPNPPAITILTGIGAGRGPAAWYGPPVWPGAGWAGADHGCHGGGGAGDG